MPYRKIIDVYGPNALNLQQAWDGGVRAIIHKASEALDVHDHRYHERKQQALAMGFLWGAYHLSSAENPARQLDYFLEMEDGSDPRILLSLDWEESRQHGIMSLAQVRDFVTLFHQRLGRYPVLYGGHTVRESTAINQGDPLLAHCPLWYQRYRSTPVGLPTATWPRYTLWQYDDEHLQNGGFSIPGTSGADWNQFDGDLADLQAAWPFSSGVGAGSPHIPADGGPGSMGLRAPGPGGGGGAYSSRVVTRAREQHSRYHQFSEDEEPLRSQIRNYWDDIGFAFPGVSTAWSAVFVSWCMREGSSVDNGFKASTAHSRFVFKAIKDRRDGTGLFHGYRINEYAPQPGDIIHNNRGGQSLTYDFAAAHEAYESHSAIVVETGSDSSGKYALTIGGNESNSVGLKRVALDGSGMVQQRASNPYISVIRTLKT
jgi:GH25 family lysozyme M1 (1,4-beta-N-acetylmuramidase)